MAKFSKNSKNHLFQTIKELMGKGNEDAYYTLAIENLIKQGKMVSFIETEDLPWIDIDTKDDFDYVKKINKEFGGW